MGRLRLWLYHRKTATMARHATRTIFCRGSPADLPAVRRGGGGRTGPFQPRQRHQRLDSRPRVAVRDLWPETHLRSPVALWQPSVCRQSGSYWSPCPSGGRPRRGVWSHLQGRDPADDFQAEVPAMHRQPPAGTRAEGCARGWAAISPPGAMTTPGRPWIGSPTRWAPTASRSSRMPRWPARRPLSSAPAKAAISTRRIRHRPAL